MRNVRSRNLAAMVVVGLLSAISCQATAWADPTAREVTSALFRAKPCSHPNLAKASLARLDLSNLDFKFADLTGANLFGADISGANLSGANLTGAMLDRATVVGTHFDAAKLDGASILRPSAFATLTPTAIEAPSFKGATLRGAKIFGRFSLSDLSGADLTDVVAAPVNRTGFIEHVWRTEFSGANLANAVFQRADFTRVLLSFANCRGANFRDAILRDADVSGADFTNADLSGADLSDADLTDADLTGANLAGANLHGARGLDRVRGMALARNTDKALH